MCASSMFRNVHQFDARGLANSAWAFAKMRFVPSASLPSIIAEEAGRKMEGFSAQVRGAGGSCFIICVELHINFLVERHRKWLM